MCLPVPCAAVILNKTSAIGLPACRLLLLGLSGKDAILWPLKYLFWLPQTQRQMSQGFIKNSQFCHHKHDCRFPDFLAEISVLLPQTQLEIVCILSPLKNIQICHIYKRWNAGLTYSENKMQGITM